MWVLVLTMLRVERRRHANRMIDAVKKHSGFAPGVDGRIDPHTLIKIMRDTV